MEEETVKEYRREKPAQGKNKKVKPQPQRPKKPRRKFKKPKKKFSILGFLIMLFFVLTVAIVLGAGGGYVFYTLSDLPKIKLLEEYSPLETSLIYSADNELLAELYIEKRTFVDYNKIPQHVKNAFIAVEDSRFYRHKGLDFFRIAGALVKDIQAGAFVQGGSTITQQLAKMLFLKPDRSINRKIKEAALSIQIERYYTKDEIMGLYLNQTYFGTRAYGIEAAASTYFNKTTINLSVAEAALLAALPKAPSSYSPFKNRVKAEKRRLYILTRMKEEGFITKMQYEEALTEPLPTTVFKTEYKNPYYVDYVKSKLEARFGDKLYTSGIRVYTTLDTVLQKIAEDAVKKGINKLRKRGRKGVQAALIAIDLKTCEIRAMVGGTDFTKTQFNRATQALRQPGSSFKPIVYFTAFNEGFTPGDVIKDGPMSYYKGTWTPRNYSRKYYGSITVKGALTKSLNAATVYLASLVGIKDVVKSAKLLGIKNKIYPYLSSALGASEVTLLEMTYAYTAFATGKRPETVYFKRVENRNGMLLAEAKYPYKKIVKENVRKYMKELLRSVVLNGTATRARVIKRPVYGKTGTTDDYSDAWFIGFDDKYAVGVWVGRDNHKPIGRGEAGGRAALPIWIEFMQNI